MHEVLVMVVTRMMAGYCVAGFTHEPDPVSGLRWLRPVKDSDALLEGDITTDQGWLMAPGDVVELATLRPRPKPPHQEDWLTDFIHQRPRVLRRLEGAAWGHFMARHLDRAPEDVLVRATRSLCLVQPERVWASFQCDGHGANPRARLGLSLPGVAHPQANSPRGIAVTDLRWCALGRAWLGERGGALQLDHQQLVERLQVEAIYVALGLSRSFQGQHWLLAIGIHTMPAYVTCSPTESPKA